MICRSGAGSVSELAAWACLRCMSRCRSASGEQRFNALPVVKAGGGLMVADKDFTAQWVQSHVPSLLAEPDRLRELGDKHGSTHSRRRRHHGPSRA